MTRKEYGRVEIVRDEASPRRFYAVRYWASAAAAERVPRRSGGAGADGPSLSDRARHARRQRRPPHGARRGCCSTTAARASRPIAGAASTAASRTSAAPTASDGRRDRRLGPRRAARPAAATSISSPPRGARARTPTRRSRTSRSAPRSRPRDGTVITGCNIENATYGLTICAERVAMFKALSEGHRAFTRIAVVADTDDADAAVRRLPPDSVGVRRRPRGRSSPTSTEHKGTHRLKELLPLPVRRAAALKRVTSASMARWSDSRSQFDPEYAADDRPRRRRRRDDRPAQAAGAGGLRALQDRRRSRAGDQDDGDSRRAGDRRRRGDGHRARHAQEQGDRARRSSPPSSTRSAS